MPPVRLCLRYAGHEPTDLWTWGNARMDVSHMIYDLQSPNVPAHLPTYN